MVPSEPLIIDLKVRDYNIFYHMLHFKPYFITSEMSHNIMLPCEVKGLGPIL